jgi:negative regulator of genetic competence, sporulation and motility
MEWFRSLFKEEYTLENFKAAGCLFTNNVHVLGAWQKKTKCISGIGGKRERSETHIHAALRELIEELFEVNPPETLLYTLQDVVKPKKVFLTDSYVTVVYSFQDLEMILTFAKFYCKQSLLYHTFPTTYMNLITDRKNVSSEIGQLVLLPFEKELYINSGFVKDINVL